VERFYKYEGLGNDFVVLDRRATGVDLDAATTRALCDRRRGIGADGVLVVLPAVGAAGRMVVHNADGSLAQMCGNGLRCVVKHLARGAADRPAQLAVETGAGRLVSQLDWQGDAVERITVAMGPARLAAPNLPPGPGGRFFRQPVGDVLGTAISMGNPHLVLLDTPPERAAELGPALEVSALFPERTNVEFCKLDGHGGLLLTVWERGVGLTDACGTGACAAVAAHALDGRLPFDAWVKVTLPGGVLEIQVALDLSQVHLRGPATFVFEGALP
jgi:diaminopimelate epimerase